MYNQLEIRHLLVLTDDQMHLHSYGGSRLMASKIKVDQLETADGSGTIALQNQLSGMTTASLPTVTPTISLLVCVASC